MSQNDYSAVLLRLTIEVHIKDWEADTMITTAGYMYVCRRVVDFIYLCPIVVGHSDHPFNESLTERLNGIISSKLVARRECKENDCAI